MIVIGKRIREVRMDRGYSQKQLAELINVHQTSISQYENGTTIPSIEILIKLVKVLDTSADYILGIKDYE